MTPYIGSTANPFSAITIQSMADIGYVVDATRADAYTLPSTSLSASDRVTRGAVGQGEGLVLLNCVVEHPEAGPDEPEPISLNLRRANARE